jgi:hypothetical protein
VAPLALWISDRAGGALWIEARGELDISNAQALDVELERASLSEVERIIVDLSGLDSIDLIGWLRWAGSRPITRPSAYPWSRPRSRAQRAIALSGSSGALPFLD